MAEFSMDKMARSVAERAMEILKDNGVLDEDIISRKHLLSEIDDLMKSPWFNNGKDDDTITHYGYVERKEAVEIVRDLCVKAEPSVTPKPETVTEFADRCRECGAKYGKLIKQEACEDAVSREAVKSALCELCGDKDSCSFVNRNCDILNAINVLPLVTLKQKTGKWIVDEAEGTRIWACHCPECGKDPQEEYIAGTENWWLSKLPNFCPYCGAKMESEE